MPEGTRSDAGELSPFDIADWLWSFRWLAAALLLCAAIWSAFLFWTGTSNSNSRPSYELVVSLYASGTPLRSVSEIVDIYRSGLRTAGLVVTSEAGAVPLVWQAESQTLADAAATEARQIADRLIADVRSQNDSLAPYMQREIVPEVIAGQYLRNTAFLDGVETGLIEFSRPTVRAVAAPRSALGVRLLLPWIACGVAFMGLAGGITFVSRWRAHRHGGSPAA